MINCRTIRVMNQSGPAPAGPAGAGRPTLEMRRPTRVIVVHDEGMGMVALTVQMRMIWREIGMAVLQNLRVAHPTFTLRKCCAMDE